MNPFSQSVFSMTAECLPCCEDGCLLTAPYGAPEFDNETEAQNYLDNLTSNCIAGLGWDEDYATISASFASNTYTIETAAPSAGGFNAITVLIPMELKAGSLLTVAYSGFSSGGSVESDDVVVISVFDANGSAVGNDPSFIDSSSAGSISGNKVVPRLTPPDFPPPPPEPYPIPETGCYVLSVQYTSGYGSTTTSASFDVTVTCDDTITSGNIRAAYDDGGDTAYLICA